MFGGEFSVRPFADVVSSDATLTPFQVLLTDPVAEREFLAEITAFDFTGSPNEAQTFYRSALGFTTGGSDSPADQHFDPAIKNALFFQRSMRNGGRVGGIVPASGEIEIVNADGGLDALVTQFAIDGRQIVVKMGRSDFDYDDFGTIFDGVGVGYAGDELTTRIRVRDRLFELAVPVQSNFYAGTGGLEGGDDLKGKPKPLGYGQVLNVPAVPVDTTNLVYQLHDGAISAIDAVYDRGVALTAAAGGSPSPEPGEYEADLTNGRFTLGATPDGLVTADFRGRSSPSYVSTTADIIRALLEDALGYTEEDFDSVAFARLNTDQGATVGIWIGPDQRLILDVIDELVSTIGGYAGFNRRNELQAGVFKAPSGVRKADLTDVEIIRIERESLGGDNDPPNWRRQVGYQKNYAVQSDLADSVTAARRAFASEQFRVAADSDASIKTSHLLATDPPPVPALFANESDASAEATRLLSLYGSQHAVYRVTVKAQAFDFDINDFVTLTYPRWDLTSGKNGRVVSIREDAERFEVELEVFV